MADLSALPTFADRDLFHVVVESPRGSTVKLKYDPRLGAMSISRPLAIGLAYPFDWGFVPSTAGPDGDPLDALVCWDVATYPGVVLPCRALGLVRVEQNRAGGGERIRNDRILAVPIAARRSAELKCFADLPQRVRDELAHFFVAATALEGKDPRILGWDDADAALAWLRASPARTC